MDMDSFESLSNILYNGNWLQVIFSELYCPIVWGVTCTNNN